MSDPQSVFGVLLGRTRNLEAPDIRLDANSAGRKPLCDYVRFHIGDLAEGQLPIAVTCAASDSEIKNGRIENRTSRGGRVNEAKAIRQPGKAAQYLTMCHVSGLAAFDGDDLNDEIEKIAPAPNICDPAIVRRPTWQIISINLRKAFYLAQHRSVERNCNECEIRTTQLEGRDTLPVVADVSPRHCGRDLSGHAT